MSDLAVSAAWGVAIAASLIGGALAAARLHLPESVAATLSALGGGILLAAVALELVPEADERAGATLTALGLLSGTLLYVGADSWLTRDRSMEMMRRSGHAAASGKPMSMPIDRVEASRGEAIAVGLFIDGVPESIALGITIAEGDIGVALLAGVLLGNVVEAYGAAHPLIASGHSKSFAVTLLAGIGLSLAAAAVLGATVLAQAEPAVIGTAEGVAAGAVLAVISISIIPYAFTEVSSRVALAAIAGFIGGYLLS
jgi:zinc transporter, ZIP family